MKSFPSTISEVSCRWRHYKRVAFSNVSHVESGAVNGGTRSCRSCELRVSEASAQQGLLATIHPCRFNYSLSRAPLLCVQHFNVHRSLALTTILNRQNHISFLPQRGAMSSLVVTILPKEYFFHFLFNLSFGNHRNTSCLSGGQLSSCGAESFRLATEGCRVLVTRRR